MRVSSSKEKLCTSLVHFEPVCLPSLLWRNKAILTNEVCKHKPVSFLLEFCHRSWVCVVGGLPVPVDGLCTAGVTAVLTAALNGDVMLRVRQYHGL